MGRGRSHAGRVGVRSATLHDRIDYGHAASACLCQLTPEAGAGRESPLLAASQAAPDVAPRPRLTPPAPASRTAASGRWISGAIRTMESATTPVGSGVRERLGGMLRYYYRDAAWRVRRPKVRRRACNHAGIPRLQTAVTPPRGPERSTTRLKTALTESTDSRFLRRLALVRIV